MKMKKMSLISVVFASLILATSAFAQTENVVSYYLPFTNEDRPGRAFTGQQEQGKWQIVTDYMKNDQFYSDDDGRLYMRSGAQAYQLLTISNEEEATRNFDHLRTINEVIKGLENESTQHECRPGSCERRSWERSSKSIVDHSSWQSPVRDQGKRSTCGVFSLLGALEALGGGIPDDLSEEDGYHLAVRYIKEDPASDIGIWPHELAEALKTDKLCKEQDWPYNPDKQDIPKNRPALAAQSGVCGVNDYLLFKVDDELRKNGHAQVEELLARGKNICATFKVAWDNNVTRKTGIIDGYCDKAGKPVASLAAHAMLIVGYDREKGYFIVKNSYGQSYGKDGYVHLTYDYFSQYAWGAWICITRDQVAANVESERNSEVAADENLLANSGTVGLPSLNLLGQ